MNKLFNIEKYIKIKRAYLNRDNDGKITAQMNISIDNDEIQKEVEELCGSLQNLHKILGYDFTLTINDNNIIFEELEVD